MRLRKRAPIDPASTTGATTILRHHDGHSVTLKGPLVFPTSSVETARLLLRVPELAEAEALIRIFWDPEVVAQKQATLVEPPGGLDLR